jgi:hypothetical protein
VPAAQIRYLGMNQHLYAPFKDKRVREAICLSASARRQDSSIYML